MKNGHKICIKFAINMVRMKDVATLDAKVVNVTFTHGHDYIYELLICESTINNLPFTCFVTIGVFPSCICPNFVSNATSFRHSFYLICKHMYYTFNVFLNLVMTIKHINYHRVEIMLKTFRSYNLLNHLVPFDDTLEI